VIATTKRGRRPPRVALWGLFGVGNLGNEASLSIALEQLRGRTPAADLVAVCRIEERVAAEHAVATHPIRLDPRFRWVSGAPRLVRLVVRVPYEFARVVKVITFLRTTDIVIVPGTGVLDDFGVGPLEEPLDLWIWTRLARIMRTPFWFLSVGAGPIENSVSRALMLGAANKAWLSYRDETSRAFMESIGHDVSGESIAPDLVFGTEPPTSGRERRGEGETVDVRTVAIGVMAYDGWRGGDADGPVWATYFDKMVELCVSLIGSGWRVEFLVGEDSDLDAVAAVGSELDRLAGEAVQSWSSRSIRSFAEVLEVVGAVDLVIATRFHNVVAALISETPVISVEYSSKNRSVMVDFGLGDFCHHVETFGVSDVLSDVARALQTFDDRSAELSAVLQRKRSLLTRQWDEVASVIGTAVPSE
jgi:polysaccharide pyruvyl transferase WcaK-like protein